MLTNLGVTEARVLALLGGTCLTVAAFLHGGFVEAFAAAGGQCMAQSGVSAYKGSATVSTPPKA
jgi:hypothetical protein